MTSEQSSSPRHIAVLWLRIGPYHKARLKGAETAARESGDRITAVELFADDPTYRWQPTSVDPQVTIQSLLTWKDRNHPGKIYNALSRLFEDAPPDVIAIPGWGSCAALVAGWWARRHGCATILMSASSQSDKKRSRFAEFLKCKWVSGFNAGLVGGTPQKQYLSTLGIPASAVHLGYNAVDNTHFTPPPQAENLNRRRAFITAARFIPLKNLDGLIHAYADYRAQVGEDNAWKLILCGDGEAKPSLEQLAAGLNLPDIEWPGFVQLDELPSVYHRADVFILPTSISETWGLVVNEAMAAGLPVITSTRVGCHMDLIRPENGRTFDPAKTEDLTRLLLEFHHMPDKERDQMGRASLETINNWGPDRFARGLFAAVDDALKNNT